VRIDGARGVCLDDVVIGNTTNTGARGITAALPGEASDAEAAYVGSEDGGHPLQGRQYGYMGADVRGLGVSASHSVHLQGVRIDGVHSTWGLARGIDVFNHAEEVHIGTLVSVNNVTALMCVAGDVLVGDYANGPKVGSAEGVHCSGGSAPGTFGGNSIEVTNVESAAFEQAHTQSVSTTIEAADVERVHINSYDFL